MAAPEVNKKMLSELESMGFPTARATRALHFSGNCSIEDSLNWYFEHEGDPDIDQIPLVPIDINIESGTLWIAPEEVNLKLQELRECVNKRKRDEEDKFQRESEKIRRRTGKELQEARQSLEENERKSMLLLRKAEKVEEKRARERIRQQLENDKAERRSKLGFQNEAPRAAKPTTTFLQEKDEDAKVKKAFQTLLTYAINVARNPHDEKFRKIRLGNLNFQDRVGKLKGGTEFLELCGFEKAEGSEYLYLPKDKVDMVVLSTAASVLHSAMTNPFLGML